MESQLATRVKNTILMVDDSRDTLLLIKKALTNKGYSLLTASKAEEALKILDEHDEVQLALIDINLDDDFNGVLLAKKLNERRKHRPLSMCFVSSAKVDDNFLAASQKIGVEAFIPKPINIDKLLGKIEDLLGGSYESLDLSQRIVCNYNCELIQVNIHPIIQLIQLTPSSFLLKSSADFDQGMILNIQCPSLAPILNEKFFTLKVIKTKGSRHRKQGILPFVARCQLLEQNYQTRLAIRSLFQKSSALPEGMRLDTSPLKKLRFEDDPQT